MGSTRSERESPMLYNVLVVVESDYEDAGGMSFKTEVKDYDEVLPGLTGRAVDAAVGRSAEELADFVASCGLPLSPIRRTYMYSELISGGDLKAAFVTGISRGSVTN